MATNQISEVMEKLLYKVPKIKVTVAKERNVNKEYRYQITCSNSAAAALARVLRETAYVGGTIDMFESFHILILNRANIVIGCATISQGGVAGTVVDPKIVFSVALGIPGACSIILAHNHPSGNTRPSQADIDITRKLKSAGDMLDIMVLDHIIVTSDDHYSFADNGLI